MIMSDQFFSPTHLVCRSLVDSALDWQRLAAAHIEAMQGRRKVIQGGIVSHPRYNLLFGKGGFTEIV